MLPQSAALVPPVPSVPGVGEERAGLRSTLGQRLFQPGWPLWGILVPFPLWWALGLSEWIVPLMVVPMMLHLLRQRPVLAPRGLGWWLAFLLWVVVGGFLLQVDAVGAVADNSSTRLITFFYRLVWYVSITIVLLYVVNTRRELSATRIARMVAALFITVTLGGLLGVVAPYFQFQSLAELALPNSLTQVELIHSMIHPQAAQLQSVLGYVAPRPSAPYTYTNTWGLNFALTLPFFLLAWLGKDAGWRRWAGGPVLLVSAVPLIYSLNRGLWGACAAMALFLAVRAARTGRPGVLAGILVGAVALGLILAVSPLGHVVSLRFASQGSATGRANLGTLSVRSVTATSPIVGLGSTRNVQGNFQSITGGSTAQCPRCSPPALGTQGQLWLVVFSQGLLGLVLFLTFFAVIFLRHIRLRSPVCTVALSVMVAWAVTLPVYNSLGTGMLVLMVAVGLLCREGIIAVPDPLPSPRDPSLTTLAQYTSALRAGTAVLLLFFLAGTLAGWAWTHVSPSPYAGTTTILLDDPPTYSRADAAAANIDTEAQLVTSGTVRKAAADASGESLSDATANLTVTATPNTRVLHLQFMAPTTAAAQAGVDAATDAFLKGRTTRLAADQASALARLHAQAATLTSALGTLDGQVLLAKQHDAPGVVDPAAEVTRLHRNELLPQAVHTAQRLAHVAGLSLSGGHRTVSTRVTKSGDVLRVDLISGGTVGLGLGALVVLLRGAAGPRLRRVEDVRGSTGLALLARVEATPRGVDAVANLLGDQSLAFLAAVERDPEAGWVAQRLTDLTSRPTHGGGAVIVASGRTRADEVRGCQDRLALQGVPVHGMVLATEPSTRTRTPTSRVWSPPLTGRAILNGAFVSRRDDATKGER